jgi:hypothetical protein
VCRRLHRPFAVRGRRVSEQVGCRAGGGG